MRVCNAQSQCLAIEGKGERLYTCFLFACMVFLFSDPDVVSLTYNTAFQIFYHVTNVAYVSALFMEAVGIIALIYLISEVHIVFFNNISGAVAVL